ncbi:MAG: hypothetical protein O2816_13230 [Planctomycetota bacterium]|nr:hypothetical protein [Planctomycetota bacterium]
MHTATTLLALTLFAAAAIPAAAQDVPRPEVSSAITAERITTPVRHAGTYHVVSGTWTRAQASAALGPDVIYNATVPTGYFGTGWEAATDEGVLPSTQNPSGGTQDVYRIDGFEFAYCSNADWIDWSFQFHDSFQPCTSFFDPFECIHTASGVITVPGAPTAGQCWTITIDLAGGSEIWFEADGGPCMPGYDGIAGLDTFGWTNSWETGDGGGSGPLLSGYDPDWMPAGEGTCYQPAQTCASGASALGAWDLGLFDLGQGWDGCYFFGGYDNPDGCAQHRTPGAQFHLRLFTDCAQGGANPCLTTSCDGPAQQGWLSLTSCSLGAGPVLHANELGGPASFAYALIGSGSGVIQDPPGAQGDLCLGGAPIGRYVADVSSVLGERISVDLVHGATGGGLGGLPAPLGGVLQPGDMWRFQVWMRYGTSSRFTDVLTATFTN